MVHLNWCKHALRRKCSLTAHLQGSELGEKILAVYKIGHKRKSTNYLSCCQLFTFFILFWCSFVSISRCLLSCITFLFATVLSRSTYIMQIQIFWRARHLFALVQNQHKIRMPTTFMIDQLEDVRVKWKVY